MIQLVCVCLWWEGERENLYVLLLVLQKCVLNVCVCVWLCVCPYHCLTESQERIICRMFPQRYRTMLRVLFPKWHPERCICVCVCDWERERNREGGKIQRLKRYKSSRICVTEQALGCRCIMHSFVYVCMLLSCGSFMCASVFLHSMYMKEISSHGRAVSLIWKQLHLAFICPAWA